MEHQPLAGITVLDLGQIYNGPYCGYLLAMAGARVIKVEPPGGERMRGSGDTLVSYPFMMLNGNKETVTLNLKSDPGREVLRGLVGRADVLLENFAPGTLDRHGVGAAALTAINPRLVYAAGTGFGRTGPHRDYRAMDITVQAMTGVMAITGHDGEPPLRPVRPCATSWAASTSTPPSPPRSCAGNAPAAAPCSTSPCRTRSSRR